MTETIVFWLVCSTLYTHPVPTPAPPVRSEDEYTQGPPKSSSQATVALVVGIVSIFLFGIILGPLAIILGVRAKKDVEESNGRLSGRGKAQAAVYCGIASIALWVVVTGIAMAG